MHKPACTSLWSSFAPDSASRRPMSSLRTRKQRRKPAEASMDASAFTTVGTDDMLQQCERLILQLSQQVLDQEKDISALRAALISSQSRHRRHRRRGGDEKRERAGTDSTAESSGAPRETLRQHRAHRTSAKASPHMKVAYEDFQLCPSLPLPTTPQVSPISSFGAAGVDSTIGPYQESTVATSHNLQHSAAESAAPSPTRSVGKSSGQQDTAVALACSPITCDVSSFSDKTNVGLTPSAVCQRPASGETTTANALSASSVLSEQVSSTSSSLPRHRGNTAQVTRHAQFETPQVKFDSQDAMSYLLSVFSSAKSAGEADGDRAAAIAKTAATTSCGRENRSGAGVRLSSALPPQQGGHVSRRLFPWDLGHEDEGSEIGDEPLHGDTVSDDGHPSAGQPLTPPSRGKRGNVDGRAMVNRKTSDAFNNEDALLQEGYARIVACALAAEFAASSTLGKEDEEGQQQQRICKTRTGTSTVARCRTTPRHDHSASATVSELLRFFTLESTPRHEPEY